MQEEAAASHVPGTVPRKKSAPKKQTAHGRIGGDDYVSGSDTFNALNDSKVDKSKDSISVSADRSAESATESAKRRQ